MYESLLIKNNSPKGIAWEGDLLRKFFDALDAVISKLLIIPYDQLKNNFNIDTADNYIINMMFTERNILNMFPQGISTEDQKAILKALALARNWVTLKDLKEFMSLLGFTLNTLDSFDILNNPNNYPYLNIIPKNEKDAQWWLYYNLTGSNSNNNQVNTWPIPFPITFTETTLDFADYLLESLVDAHIRLIAY